MIPAILVGTALAALIAVYMSRPRFRRTPISALRFLHDLPPARHSPLKLAVAPPLTSLLFWLQLLMLAALFAALMLAGLQGTQAGSRSLGLWLMLDTSWSMTTLQGGAPRWDAARATARRLIERAAANAGGAALCVRVSAFDRDRRDLTAGADPGAALAAIEALAPRPVGTDLALIQAALTLPATPGCPITHLAVVTDRPAQEMVNESGRTVLWRDVGEIVTNIGIEEVSGSWDLFAGELELLRVTARIHGRRGTAARLEVLDPQGAVLADQPLEDWSREGTAALVVAPRLPGDHLVRLTTGGAYAGDDRMRVTVPPRGSLVVDWRAPPSPFAGRLGWRQLGADPRGPARLRVLDGIEALAQAGAEVPTLVLGPGWRPGVTARIALVQPRHPVLAEVNLDLLEEAGMAAVDLPEGFAALATGDDGAPFIGIRPDPPAVILPGAPLEGAGAVERATTVLFFNALRWLLATDQRLLDPRYVDEAGQTIAAGPEEGETGLTPRSLGLDAALVPVERVENLRFPLWPFAAIIAALMFACERILAARRGAA